MCANIKQNWVEAIDLWAKEFFLDLSDGLAPAEPLLEEILTSFKLLEETIPCLEIILGHFAHRSIVTTIT